MRVRRPCSRAAARQRRRSSSRGPTSPSPPASASTNGEGGTGPGRGGIGAGRHGLRRARSAVARQRRLRLRIRIEPDRREHLGRDQLDARLGGEPLTRHAAQRALHGAPAREDMPRRAHAEHLALASLVVGGVCATRLERAHVAGPHLARESCR